MRKSPYTLFQEVSERGCLFHLPCVEGFRFGIADNFRVRHLGVKPLRDPLGLLESFD